MVDVIENGEDEEEDAYAKADVEDEVCAEAEDLQEGESLDGDDLWETAIDGGPGHEANHGDLDQVHEELQAALAVAEHFAEAANGAERGEIDGEALRGEIEADLYNVGDDDDENCAANEGKCEGEREMRPTLWRTCLRRSRWGSEIGERGTRQALGDDIAEGEDQLGAEPFHEIAGPRGEDEWRHSKIPWLRAMLPC